MGELDGRVAIVTGAGQGVGRGIALALAGAGATVVIAGRTHDKLRRTADEVTTRGGRALAVACDVTRRTDVEGCVAAALEHFGAVDILVNNAQSVALGPILGITEDDARMVWESGWLGSLLCMQACFEALSASQGCVVNLGTGAALRPDPAGAALYAGVKEAVRTLTRAAAVEWGPHGIRVNAVIPLAASSGFERWAQWKPDEYAALLRTVPLGRVGDCEGDIGRAVAFLAGPAAAYITGTTLTVDGGQAYLR